MVRTKLYLELHSARFDLCARQSRLAAIARGDRCPCMQWYMNRIETICGDAFAVGGKLSLVDLLIYNKLAEVLTDSEIPRPDFPAGRRYPFGNKEATDAALQQYPKLSAIIASVKADPVCCALP